MKRVETYRRLAVSRPDQVLKLNRLVNQLIPGDDDPLDDLGLLRLAEIQIGQVRKAIVAEAKLRGFNWQQIGDTLCISAEDAQLFYGRI